MKLQDALWKTIRQFGVSVIQEKRLMPFLADYRAFDDCPAVRDVMNAIATGEYREKLCLAACESNEEWLRCAGSLKKSLVIDRNFRQELADYAVDSVSFAFGLVPSVKEPDDYSFDAVQKKAGEQVNRGSQENRNAQRDGNAHGSPADSQKTAPKQSSRRTGWVISGNSWQTASDGAESHRRFYRGKDLTSAFENGLFSAAVADGSFRDIFPGDYIIRKITVPAAANKETGTYKVKFIIADLDSALKPASHGVTAHHAVIVPEAPVFDTYMNLSNTNTGGYAGSCMQRTAMPVFANGLSGAFGAGHLLEFSPDGAEIGASDGQHCLCRLMTLSMVFGQTLPKVYSWSLSWPDVRKDSCLGGVQLAAFRLHQELQGNGLWYWVSDVLSKSSSPFTFVLVNGGVGAVANDASYAGGGVRPFALLL